MVWTRVAGIILYELDDDELEYTLISFYELEYIVIGLQSFVFDYKQVSMHHMTELLEVQKE